MKESMEPTKGNILWVDDEIELLRAHIVLLKEKGYSVETATNGDDAIEMVKHGVIDLVLIDEMMPRSFAQNMARHAP